MPFGLCDDNVLPILPFVLSNNKCLALPILPFVLSKDNVLPLVLDDLIEAMFSWILQLDQYYWIGHDQDGLDLHTGVEFGESELDLSKLFCASASNPLYHLDTPFFELQKYS